MARREGKELEESEDFGRAWDSSWYNFLTVTSGEKGVDELWLSRPRSVGMIPWWRFELLAKSETGLSHIRLIMARGFLIRIWRN